MGTTNRAAIYSNGGNRWNIIGFNFTKRDALSSVYKISMVTPNGVNFKLTRNFLRVFLKCICQCKVYKTLLS